MAEDRGKVLESAIAQIEKQYGKGAIMRLGNRDVLVPVSVIPSGAVSLDAALGVGGFPRGRVIEIFGPESGGKTTMTLHVIAQAQKMGGQAAFIDAEHALDPSYARRLGVDVDNLLVSQPDNGEQALEIAETLISSGALDVVVVDSVAALVPRAELEGDMGDPQMGLQARLMSQALRKLTGKVSKSRTCLIFINQIREKIGVMFGNPETTTGGRALKFYASIRLDIRRIQAIKDGDRVIRLPHARKSGEKQSGRAVPRSGVRHPLRRGHFARRRPARFRRRAQCHREERHVAQLWRRAPRPGPRKRARVLERTYGHSRANSNPRCARSSASRILQRGGSGACASRKSRTAARSKPQRSAERPGAHVTPS